MQKLNVRGAAHYAALAVVVVGIAAFGTYKLVASHANTLFVAFDSLKAGSCMQSGQYILDYNGSNKLTMGSDGNLILTNYSGQTVWSSHTQSAGSRACMQSDGNFVINSSAGTALWQTRTNGSGADNLQIPTGSSPTVQVVRNASGQNAAFGYWNIFWQSRVSQSINDNELLAQNESLVGGSYKFTFQTDGNAVIRNSAGTAIWNSGTTGKGGKFFGFYVNDGKLHIYGTSMNSQIWNSNNATFYGSDYASKLVMQTDGNLVLYSYHGVAIWSSHTAGK